MDITRLMSLFFSLNLGYFLRQNKITRQIPESQKDAHTTYKPYGETKILEQKEQLHWTLCALLLSPYH